MNKSTLPFASQLFSSPQAKTLWSFHILQLFGSQSRPGYTPTKLHWKMGSGRGPGMLPTLKGTQSLGPDYSWSEVKTLCGCHPPTLNLLFCRRSRQLLDNVDILFGNESHRSCSVLIRESRWDVDMNVFMSLVHVFTFSDNKNLFLGNFWRLHGI